MTHPAPTTTSRPQAEPAPAAATPPAELGLEARMAAVDAAMSVRLDMATAQYEVNTAHLADGIDLADIVTAPPTPAAPIAHRLPDLYPTPVAALLQRAHHRLETSGWCSGALVDEQGAVCLLGAIRKEAGGSQTLEARGLEVLMDAIRRRFGPVDSVPAFNDAWGTARAPMRVLGEAATLADARGI